MKKKFFLLEALVGVFIMSSCLAQSGNSIQPSQPQCVGSNVCVINAAAFQNNHQNTNQLSAITDRRLPAPVSAEKPSNKNQTEIRPDYILTKGQPSTTIRLSSNPTTGYMWQLTSYDSQLLTVEKLKYVRENNLIGGGGNEVWEIRLTERGLSQTQPQITKVKFDYLRPWEHNQAPSDTKILYIQIR